MYVDDCAEAIRRVTEQGRQAQVYNIGTQFEKCNLTEMIHVNVEKILARNPTQIQFQPIADRPYHRRYYIDFSKIHTELGWHCTTPFEEGLARTLQYYIEEHNRMQKECIVAKRPQA